MIDTIRLSSVQYNFKLPIKVKKLITFYQNETGYTNTMAEIFNDKERGFRYIYYHDSDRLDVELSVPKILIGTSVYNIAYKHQTIKYMVDAIVNTFFHNSAKVYINRIDICHNVYFDKESELNEYIHAHKNKKIHKQRVAKFTHQKYADTVCYYGKEYSIKLYNKTQEERHTNKKWDYPFYCARFEMGIRTQKLIKILQLSKYDLANSYKPYFGIETDTIIWRENMLLNYFNEYIKKWSAHAPATYFNNSNVLKYIAHLTNKQVTKADIHNLYADKAISKSTYYRIIKSVEDQKVNLPTLKEVKLLPDLQVIINQKLTSKNLIM